MTGSADSKKNGSFDLTDRAVRGSGKGKVSLVVAAIAWCAAFLFFVVLILIFARAEHCAEDWKDYIRPLYVLIPVFSLLCLTFILSGAGFIFGIYGLSRDRNKLYAALGALLNLPVFAFSGWLLAAVLIALRRGDIRMSFGF